MAWVSFVASLPHQLAAGVPSNPNQSTESASMYGTRSLSVRWGWTVVVGGSESEGSFFVLKNEQVPSFASFRVASCGGGRWTGFWGQCGCGGLGPRVGGKWKANQRDPA